MEYLHASADALASLFSLSAMIGLAIGIGWGLLVSFMPGVGGNVAIALLLPFIFRLPVPEAIALLLGTHIATYFGGSITSITMNIPASSKSVSLCWDGYPLARKGKGAYALGASATASGLGGVVGAVVLTLGIPIMKQLLNVIGSPEIFMLAVWGIVIIAVFSSGDLLKGVMAGGLGILLSWVGESPITGENRLTFGSDYLSQGIQFATAAMGLFAVAQAIRLLAESRRRAAVTRAAQAGLMEAVTPETIPQTSTTWSGALAVFKRWRLSLYMSFFGVFTGTIPGLGAPVAAIAAYGQAAQMSKNKQEFGHGAVEGVIAPQATDAAAEGGGMLPMLALGIPTHEQQAILLSAFVVLGIAPGPTMLTDHLDVVFTVIWIIVLASLVVSIIGLTTGRWLAKLSALPALVLVPLILVIAIVGSFAVNGRIGDSVMTVLFGLLGYLCFKYNYSRVNLIIGLALGAILENNLHISTQLYGNAFLLHRPVAGGLAIVVLATVVWWVWSRRAARRKQDALALPDAEGNPTAGAPGWGAVATAVGFVATFAVAAAVGSTYGPLTGQILTAVSLFCLVLAVANAARVILAQVAETRSVKVTETGNGPARVATSSSRVAVMEHETEARERIDDLGPDGTGSRGSDTDWNEPGQRPAGLPETNLVDLALARRGSREAGAAKARGYEFSSVLIVLGFLAVVLLLGVTIGVGVAMALFWLLATPRRDGRTVAVALAWGIAVSAATWLLFNTLVSQFIPYTGLLWGR